MGATIRNIRAALADRAVLRNHHAPLKKYDYAFIVHPRNLDDVYKQYPVLRVVPGFLARRILRGLWPVRIAPIYGLTAKDGSERKGVVIACPPVASDLLRDPVGAKNIIVRASRLATMYGAKAIGLGALTASLSRGGLDVAEALSHVTVVTGRLYTIHNICELAFRVFEEMHYRPAEVRVAIVGAAGSIGSGCAELLASKGIRYFALLDHAGKQDAIQQIALHIAKQEPGAIVTTGSDLAVLRNADVVITATNHPDALICSEHIGPGTVIIDDAQPTDVERGLFDREDVLVLEGGVVASRSIRIPFAFGLQKPGDIFSCLAELLVVARSEPTINVPVGRVEMLPLDILSQLRMHASELGLSSGSFQNMYRHYTSQDVERVRRARRVLC